jgi:hypothetical protein
MRGLHSTLAIENEQFCGDDRDRTVVVLSAISQRIARKSVAYESDEVRPVASDAQRLPPRAAVSSRTVHEPHTVRGEQYEEEDESSPGDFGGGSDPSVRFER